MSRKAAALVLLLVSAAASHKRRQRVLYVQLFVMTFALRVMMLRLRLLHQRLVQCVPRQIPKQGTYWRLLWHPKFHEDQFRGELRMSRRTFRRVVRLVFGDSSNVSRDEYEHRKLIVGVAIRRLATQLPARSLAHTFGIASGNVTQYTDYVVEKLVEQQDTLIRCVVLYAAARNLVGKTHSFCSGFRSHPASWIARCPSFTMSACGSLASSAAWTARTSPSLDLATMSSRCRT